MESGSSTENVLSSSHKEMASFSFGTSTRQNGLNNSLQEGKVEKMNSACEIIVLVTCIGLTWMLLLIPIIFFHLPDSIYVSKYM